METLIEIYAIYYGLFASLMKRNRPNLLRFFMTFIFHFSQTVIVSILYYTHFVNAVTFVYTSYIWNDNVSLFPIYAAYFPFSQCCQVIHVFFYYIKIMESIIGSYFHSFKVEIVWRTDLSKTQLNFNISTKIWTSTLCNWKKKRWGNWGIASFMNNRCQQMSSWCHIWYL